MRKFLVVLMLLAVASVAFAQDGPPPEPMIDGEIFVDGLHGPMGLYVDAEGNLWVAESGLGGEQELTFFNPVTYAEEPANLGETARLIRVSPDGEQEVMATLPSVTVALERIAMARIAANEDDVYVASGIWAEFLGDEITIPLYGGIVALNGGEPELVANTWDHENANNPDGINLRETHPYGIAFGPDGLLYVADAAANALLSVDVSTGDVATVAVFEPTPGVFPNPVMDGELLAQAVPTAVVFDDAGTLYVSHLSGAPFVPGSAKVVTVAEDGTVEPFAEGLTMLTDLEAAPDGNMYATQFAIFGQQGPEFNSGGVVRIMPDGTSEMVISGLPMVTAIAIDENGGGYVAINGQNLEGLVPDGIGMVIYYPDLMEREGMPMPEMPPPAS